MAIAVSDRDCSQYGSVSGGCLSAVALSLATGLSQQQQELEQFSGEQREDELSGEEEEMVGEKREDIFEAESSEKRSQLRKEAACEVARVRIRNGTTSSTTSTSENGVQCLLENVPQVKAEFEVLSKIGEGTYSSVYLARLRGRTEMQFALKHLVPTSASSRIQNELKCLQSMGGKDNVIPLLTCARHRDHIVLIMPYFPHTKFNDYLHLMTPHEVQLYMKALFTALCNVHSHRVIHRDIKPSNFLYDRDTGRFQLVDFGLAHLEPNKTTLSSTQSAHSKSSLRLNRTGQTSLTTPPTSSSAHVTKTPVITSTHHTPQTQVHHLNGTATLVPPHTYRRQVHGKLQSTVTTELDGRRGRVTEKKGGRKRKGENEDGGTGGSNGETGGVCPLRHKKTELCDVCQNRSHQNAPRAGTPGFRAPEVLLKCPLQTTAVDVWSAGVILLCLLSGRYPFFRASDDLSALAQIISLMGTTECTKVAKELGKDLVCDQKIDAVDLRELCQTLRQTLHTHLLKQQQQQQQNQSLHLHTYNKKISAEYISQPPPNKKNKLTNDTGDGGDDGVGEKMNLATPHAPCCYKLRSPQQRRGSPRQTQSLTKPNTLSNTPCNNSHTLISPSSSSSTSSPSLSVSSSGVCNRMSVREVTKSWESLPESVYDLLSLCLELNPSKRVTAQEALQHPFVADVMR